MILKLNNPVRVRHIVFFNTRKVFFMFNAFYISMFNNIVIDSINYIKIFMFVIDRRQLLKPEINWLIEKLCPGFPCLFVPIRSYGVIGDKFLTLLLMLAKQINIFRHGI